MLAFATSFLAILVAFVLPALAGFLAIAAVGRMVSPRYLVAFSLGIFFLFFSDTIGGSSYLDVNAGFAGGVQQVALVLLFVGGVVLFFSFDRALFAQGAEPVGTGVAVPLLVALAVGVHGLGEGAAFSATAAATSSTSLLDAFGGVSAAVAFVLHKAIEPLMVGAVYLTYSGDRAKETRTLIRDVLLMTLVFVLPGAVGAATDYSLGYDTTYAFALSTGASIYAGLRLSKPLFGDRSSPGTDSLRLALVIVMGFLCLYLAALFHS